MRTITFFILAGLIFFSSFGLAKENNPSLQPQKQSMIKNEGQWDPEVRYLARTGGLNCWITSRGVVYDLYRIETTQQPSITGHVVRMEFEGVFEDIHFESIDVQQSVHNYCKGKDQTRWVSDVTLCGEVVARNLYDGIDSRFYFDGPYVRYDIIVHPGADLTQVKMNFEGQDGLQLSDQGELLIQTSMGNLEHRKIFAYQNINGSKKEVQCAFQIRENGSVTFITGKYDDELPLIIDPLVFSTYIGGTGSEWVYGMAVDDDQNVYITGATESLEYPVTSGAYQFTAPGGFLDIYLSKLNSDGTELIYSTYLGGSDTEEGYALVVDQSHTAYLGGYTYSTNYPVTTGCYQSLGNGQGDGVLSIFDASGLLSYSTYLGGSEFDEIRDLALDDLQNVILFGNTQSVDFPTAAPYQASYAGHQDCFLTKFDPGTSSLVFSTFFWRC